MNLIPRLALAVLISACLSAADPPPDLIPYFTPPAEFSGDLGPFRPILKFNDGTPITTPADWQRRRLEILESWHKVMGPWPALIERPKLERLDVTDRDGFKQYRINVEIANTA
jgi:hypothetical protein